MVLRLFRVLSWLPVVVVVLALLLWLVYSTNAEAFMTLAGLLVSVGVPAVFVAFPFWVAFGVVVFTQGHRPWWSITFGALCYAVTVTAGIWIVVHEGGLR